MHLATGIDLEREVTGTLSGSCAGLVPQHRRVAAIDYLELPVGVVLAIDGLAEVRELAYVDELKVPWSVGDRITPVLDTWSRHGHVIVSADDHDTLQVRRDLVREAILTCFTIDTQGQDDDWRAAS